MQYIVTLPDGEYKGHNGPLHEMFPFEFKDGKCLVDTGPEYFPHNWRLILVNMVGEPIIEELQPAEEISVKKDDGPHQPALHCIMRMKDVPDGDPTTLEVVDLDVDDTPAVIETEDEIIVNMDKLIEEEEKKKSARKRATKKSASKRKQINKD